MKSPVLAGMLLFLFAYTAGAQVSYSGKMLPGTPDSLALTRLLQQGASLELTDTAKATVILLEVRNTANKVKQPWIEAQASIVLGNIFYRQQLYHRAFGNYINAKNIYDDNNFPVDITELTVALARTQYHRGNYRLAVNNFVEALQLARQGNHKELEAEALENLGLLYNSFQGFNEGTAYYVKAYGIKLNLGDEKGAVRVAQVLAETYYRKRQFDSSCYYSELARLGAERLGMSTENYMAAINKAMSLVRLKKWEEAAALLKSVEKTVYNNQDMNRRLRFEIASGNLYLSRGDTAAAASYYARARKQATDNSFPEMYALVYRNMAESYYELNDYKHAYEYFSKYNNYITQLYSGRNLTNLGSLENIMNAATSRDEVKVLSLQNELKQTQLLRELLIRQGLERENALMDSVLAKEKSLSEALQRENLGRQKELDKETALKAALDRENNLVTAQLGRRKTTMLILTGGVLLLLFSAAAILFLYRKQKRKNEVIERQSQDMQILLKEIHHRVKNNLQVISSLLDLQSLTIHDSGAYEAVKEGKNRVQSMALIHQNLYNEGNLKGIRAREYINNLTRSLCDSYNISMEKLEVHTDIDDLNLDVDTMIPLGLILNELVSNSLKYAFRDVEKGELSILLKKQANNLLLRVSDNGSGYPEGVDAKTGRSFGLKMIRAFAQKLKAKLAIYNDNGAVVEMQITKYNMA